MNLGPHTVTVINYTDNPTPGRVGPGTPTQTRTDVTGCFMQPITVSEVISETDVSTRTWRCLAPPVAAVLAIDTTSEIAFNGDTFEVTGTKPFADFAGTDHVTIDCKIQQG